jgi:hypothetical protein
LAGAAFAGAALAGTAFAGAALAGTDFLGAGAATLLTGALDGAAFFAGAGF